MRNVLNFIVTYPIALASGFIVLICVAWLVLISSQAAQFQTEVGERLGDKKRLERHQQTQVKVPPEKPDEPVVVKQITVNQAAINELKTAYNDMKQEARDIFARVRGINNPTNDNQHLPMIDGLFPDPGIRANLPFDAREKYRESFSEFVQEYREASFLPRLNAGGPVDFEPIRSQLNQKVEQALSRFLRRRSFEQLQASDRLNLVEDLDRILLVEILEYIRSIHIYCDDPAQNNTGQPFHVEPFAYALRNRPSMEQLWEGQMGLWIQQDIVQAIAKANHVHNPTRSVVESPVKRLMNIEVLPGYVGITSSGGLRSGGKTLSAEDVLKQDINSDLPDDYTVSHTGRKSNALYDVRHAKLTVLVDFQKIGGFLQALSEVNFMTVLDMQIRQIDEYEHFKQGYVYGYGDVVEAQVLIETLWLRRWTSQWMPEVIREKLGVADPNAEEDQEAEDQS